MKTLSHLFLLALLAVIALAALASLSAGAGAQPHQSAAQSGIATSDSSVFDAPSISAQKIDTILCSASSPACNTGDDLYTYGKQYGIDPAFALAFFQHESSFGKAGIARETHSLGNIRCSAGYDCIGGFRAYKSWSAGYQDWYQLINWYRSTLKKTTIREILYTYAPTSENATDHYIEVVCSSVNAWRAS